MNWAHYLQRVLGAVIIMIACLTASPAAFAHAGHERADAAQITGTPAAILDGMALRDADDAVIPLLKAKAETSSLPDSAKRCIGSCCTSSHACCAVSLPMNAGALAVPTSASLALVEPPFRDGLNPEALRKPPRSLA
jgi:hypothetical protein